VTTVYVALISDRHSDPEPEVFASADAAIQYAKDCAAKYSLDGTYEQTDIPGWLFYATYSPESDSVRVQAKEVRA
jgi:hypothetical protein